MQVNGTVRAAGGSLFRIANGANELTTSWYYADRDRQRQGPVQAPDLVQRFRRGAIALDTLVWREGLGEWRPLRDFTAELALDQTPEETFYGVVDPVPASLFAPAAAAPESPYAPPVAALTSDEAFYAGGNVVQAGFWKRTAAYAIDAVVVTIAAQMVLMVAFFGMNVSSFTRNPENMLASASGLLFLASIYLFPLILFGIYYAGFHASSRQATLGKMAVGIKVVRGDGRRISLARGIGRFFAFILSGLLLHIGYFMAAFTERKQGLHDMICDTLVVDRWAFTAHPEWQRPELGTVTVVILVIAGVLLLGLLALLAMMIGLLAASIN